MATLFQRTSPMMSIEKHRTLARELAGEAWDYERRQLAAQAHVRRKAATVPVTQPDPIQREDAMFEDPQAAFGDLNRGGHNTGSRFHASRPSKGARSRTD